MSIVTFIDEAEAPVKHDGRGLTRSRNIDAQTKQCRSCDRILPFRLFVPTGSYIKSLGRKCGSADCRQCLEQQRRAAGIPKPLIKVNGKGEVYCSNCKRYLPSSQFKPHPNRNKPGKTQQWWAYCMPCVRELDRLRYRGTVATKEGRRKVCDGRNRRKRRQSRIEFAERREFLASSIVLLQRRGLTLASIARVTELAAANLDRWRRQQISRPTENVIKRIEQMVLLTMDWPAGEPARRNRLPHPREAELRAAMAETIAATTTRRGRHHRKGGAA